MANNMLKSSSIWPDRGSSGCFVVVTLAYGQSIDFRRSHPCGGRTGKQANGFGALRQRLLLGCRADFFAASLKYGYETEAYAVTLKAQFYPVNCLAELNGTP
ncbi:hypothetical protein [Marinobacter sp. X15-166B]|uniref:hypothetical protein n=1 Tax=Marinobacter sp. X15-166B TaxID=1897620 RepID=UPI00114CF06E|nr:hypothetical protein [Marinobacter sp. X15-166B]